MSFKLISNSEFNILTNDNYVQIYLIRKSYKTSKNFKIMIYLHKPVIISIK